MGLFTGKKGLVFGIANERSIAWAITQKLQAEGADIGFTHLPDKDPERPRNERRLRQLVDEFNPKLVMACDVSNDANVDDVFAKAKETYGDLDFVLHSIAFATVEDLKGPVYNCSRDGFKLAMDVSCYSLIALARRAKDVIAPGGAMLTLTYLGGEKVVPGYNMMGLCKAALESAVEYLAHELGSEKQIRVNALSAGPLRTLAASAVGEIELMQKLYTAFSPMRRCATHEEVGNTGMFLLSPLASGITGENVHVDCGYHIMGGPPVELEISGGQSS